MSAESPLRVGIVGFGEIAQYHLRHLAACGAAVVGAVTSRPTPAGVVRFDTIDALLPHLDAITVATPNHLHAAACLQAIAAGVPALVEKPLCITRHQLAALERAWPDVRRPITLGFRLRWNPALRALHAGPSVRRSIACTYRLGIERLAHGKPWTRRVAESGGAWFTLGIHALDLARWLAHAAGEPLLDVTAAAGDRQTGADFPRLASLSGVTPGGIRIDATADLRGDAPFCLEVILDGDRIDFSAGFPRPSPEDPGAADAEYAGLIAGFVRAARTNTLDVSEMNEVLESHRELVTAAELVAQ